MEPLSIATALASYLVSRTTLEAIGQGVLGGRVDAALCGVARQSVRPVQAIYRRLKEQEARGQAPTNHDVERGIYRAYLQASLSIVIAELGVMNVEPPRARWQGFRRRRALRVEAYPYVTWLERTYRHLQEEYDRMQADDNQLPPPLAVRPEAVDDAGNSTFLSEAPSAVAVVAADLNVLLAPPTQVDDNDALNARIEKISAALTDLVGHILTAKEPPPPNFAPQFRERLQGEWYTTFSAFFAEATKTTPRLRDALHHRYFSEVREALRRSDEHDADSRDLLAQLPTAETFTQAFETRLSKDSAETRARIEAVTKQLRTLGLRGAQMLTKLTDSVATLTPLLQSLAVGQDVQQTTLDAIRSVVDRQHYRANEARLRVAQRFARLTREFAGRDNELCTLDAFLAERNHGILLVYGPAGAGKSTLVANWLATYAQRHPDADVRPRFAYHAFSQEAGTTDRTDAYVHLLRQVYETTWLEGDEDTDAGWGTYALENKALEELRAAIDSHGASPEAPLVLVVDALDEAKRVESGKQLELPVPLDLPPHVYLVASVRDMSPSPLPLYLREWEHRSDQAVFVTPSLSTGAIAAWLEQNEVAAVRALAEQSEVVQHLYEVSEGGYPLYLRFLLTDLEDAVHSSASLKAIYGQTPKGFGAYVREAVERMQGDLSDQRLEDLFALLTVTLGPIDVADVQALEATRRFRVSSLTPQIRRWISVVRAEDEREALSFAHPKLALVFREEFRNAARDAEEALLDYCQAWASHHSPYALRYVSDHLVRALEDTEEPPIRDALYALARDKAYRAAVDRQLPTAFDVPLRPLSHALDDAIRTESAPDIAEFMLAHAATAQTLRQRPPRRIWLQTRSLDAALAAATHLMPSSLGIFEHLALAWTLHNEGQTLESEKTLEALPLSALPTLNTAQALLAPWMLSMLSSYRFTLPLAIRLLRDDDLSLLSIELIHLDNLEAARQIAQSINDPVIRADVLAAVAEALAGGDNADPALSCFEAARKAALSIGDFSERARALTTIAAALARSGHTHAAKSCLKAAREAAHSVEDSSKRAHTLTSVANAFADEGYAEAARQIAQSINDPVIRADVLAAVAEALAGGDNADPALSCFEAARKAALSIGDFSERARALTTIAAALARSGHTYAAFATVQSVRNSPAKREAYAIVAEALANVGLTDEARATAQSINHPPTRIRALVAIAKALANAGNTEEARTLVDAARRAAQTRKARLTAATNESSLQALITVALAISGDLEATRATARSIDSPSKRAEALTTSAVAFAKAGNAQAAHAIVRSIEDESKRANALANVSTTLASVAVEFVRSSNLEAACDIAHLIEDSSEKEKVLAAVAQSLARTGSTEAAQSCFDAARELTHSLDTPSKQVGALTAAAVAFAKAGSAQAANVTAQSIPYAPAKARALTLVVNALANTGLAEAAHATADSIDDSTARTYALSTVAEAYAKAGLAEVARKTAQSIHDFSTREEALGTVAKHLATIGNSSDTDLHLKEAFKTAQAIDGPAKRAVSLAVVAKAFASAGFASAASKTAQSIGYTSEKAEALTAVAEALTKTGHADTAQACFDDARKAAQSIGYAPNRAKALTVLAEALARSDHADAAQACFGDARKTAQSVKEASERTRALRLIVETLVKTGDLHAAHKTAQSISYHYGQQAALTLAATAFASVGLTGDARAIAQSISYAPTKAYTLVAVAEALIRKGHTDAAQSCFGAARETAQSIENFSKRARSLKTLAVALARVGFADAAFATAQSVDRGPENRKTLAAVMDVLIRTDHISIGTQVVSYITDDLEDALNSFALACTRATSSRPLLSLAPILAHYHSSALGSLPALITHYPESASSIFEQANFYFQNS